MNATENIPAAIWCAALVACGIVAVVRMFRAVSEKRPRASLPAWNAAPAEIFTFAVFAAICLFGTGFFCAAVARTIFPDTDFQKNFLYLIPVTQPVTLAAFVAFVWLRREAFPRTLNAEPAARAQRWISPTEPFGVPAFFAAAFLVVTAGALLTTAFAAALPESARAIFEERQILVDALSEPGQKIVAALCVPSIVIFTPIFEELVFRVGVFRFLKSRMPVVPAAILSSVIFAILHDAPSSYLPLTLFGCVLCFAYEKTGRIAAPIIVHALFNANTLFCLWLTQVPV